MLTKRSKDKISLWMREDGVSVPERMGYGLVDSTKIGKVIYYKSLA